MGKHKRRAQAVAVRPNQVGQKDQPQGLIQFSASRTSWSGPLPPPEILEKYSNAFPGCAERIVEMAEKQAEHRRALEAKVVDSNVRSQSNGQTLGFILAAIVLVGSFYLIAIDKDATGIGLIIGNVTTLLGVFMWGRRQQRKERVEKTQAFSFPRS